MDPEYFAVMAYVKAPDGSDDYITAVATVGPCNARTAHDNAANGFRKQQRIPTNIHVNTKTLHRCATATELDAFMEKFTSELTPKE